jgi:hypothetical protein
VVRAVVLVALVAGPGAAGALAEDASPLTSPSTERNDAGTLLTVTLPLAALPISPLVGDWAVLTYRVWAPGASASFPAVSTEAGAVLCVIAGTLGAAVDGAGAGVLRGTDRPDPPATEPLAANAEVALQRGDCLRHPLSVAVAVHNPGPEDLRVLEASTWARPDPTGDGTVARDFHEVVHLSAWPEASVSRLAVRLVRLILAPGEVVPPPPSGAQQLAAPEAASDAYALGLAPAGGFFNAVDRPVPILVVTVAEGEE